MLHRNIRTKFKRNGNGTNIRQRQKLGQVWEKNLNKMYEVHYLQSKQHK